MISKNRWIRLFVGEFGLFKAYLRKNFGVLGCIDKLHVLALKLNYRCAVVFK